MVSRQNTGHYRYCVTDNRNHNSPEGWVDGEEDDTEFPDQNGTWDETD
jgi:hypothetical protein